jgi:hypothetical protein
LDQDTLDVSIDDDRQVIAKCRILNFVVKTIIVDKPLGDPRIKADMNIPPGTLSTLDKIMSTVVSSSEKAMN